MDKENVAYTMEFYSAMKRNEIVSFAGKRMEQEIIMLNEISSPTEINITFSLICRSQGKTNKQVKGFAREMEGEGKRGCGDRQETLMEGMILIEVHYVCLDISQQNPLYNSYMLMKIGKIRNEKGLIFNKIHGIVCVHELDRRRPS
jgi:hypothetical protein